MPFPNHLSTSSAILPSFPVTLCRAPLAPPGRPAARARRPYIWTAPYQLSPPPQASLQPTTAKSEDCNRLQTACLRLSGRLVSSLVFLVETNLFNKNRTYSKAKLSISNGGDACLCKRPGRKRVWGWVQEAWRRVSWCVTLELHSSASHPWNHPGTHSLFGAAPLCRLCR